VWSAWRWVGVDIEVGDCENGFEEPASWLVISAAFLFHSANFFLRADDVNSAPDATSHILVLEAPKHWRKNEMRDDYRHHTRPFLERTEEFCIHPQSKIGVLSSIGFGTTEAQSEWTRRRGFRRRPPRALGSRFYYHHRRNTPHSFIPIPTIPTKITISPLRCCVTSYCVRRRGGFDGQRTLRHICFCDS
jgi:hypothetical protein